MYIYIYIYICVCVCVYMCVCVCIVTHTHTRIYKPSSLELRRLDAMVRWGGRPRMHPALIKAGGSPISEGGHQGSASSSQITKGSLTR